MPGIKARPPASIVSRAVSDLADFGDAPVLDPYVGGASRGSQAVVNGRAANYKIEVHSGFTPASRATFCQRAISCLM